MPRSLNIQVLSSLLDIPFRYLPYHTLHKFALTTTKDTYHKQHTLLFRDCGIILPRQLLDSVNRHQYHALGKTCF